MKSHIPPRTLGNGTYLTYSIFFSAIVAVDLVFLVNVYALSLRSSQEYGDVGRYRVFFAGRVQR
jgi:hypothetical protein